MNHSGKLKVKQETYDMRLRNMRRCLTISDPPPILIAACAEQLVKCFHVSWPMTLHAMKMRFVPHWILMIIDGEYRKMSREFDKEDLREFEDEIREKLKNANTGDSKP